jgi:hypothetical protein
MVQGALTPDRLARWRKLTAEDDSNTGSLAQRKARAGRNARKDPTHG